MPDPEPPPEPPAPDAPAIAPDTLDQRVAAAEREQEQAADTHRRQSARDDEDRSWIGRRVIDLFVGVVAAVLLLLFQALGSRDWPTAAAQASDVLKTAVVPIVTLVLGYYFGKSGRL